MKLKSNLYALLLVLGAVVSASFPPAAVLHCVNDISRSCEGFHSNYECICKGRDRMLYCLAIVSPYGNYKEARDHFLRTCIDHIPALINDPDFNLDLSKTTVSTTVDSTPTNGLAFPSSAPEHSDTTETPFPLPEPTILTTEASFSEKYPSTSIQTLAQPVALTSDFESPKAELITTSTGLSSKDHFPVSTEPLPMPAPVLPTYVTVHIPSGECDDYFEDDPEQDYGDDYECECQCDCGDDDEE